MVDVPINVSIWLVPIVVNVLLGPLFTPIDVTVLVCIPNLAVIRNVKIYQLQLWSKMKHEVLWYLEELCIYAILF